MNNINILKKTIRIFLASSMVCLGLCISSCTDYLDKAPEASFTPNDIFGNFVSFQGWTEQLYACVCNPNQILSNQYQAFCPTETLSSRVIWPDDGGYWTQRFLYGNVSLGGNALQGERGVGDKYLWPLAWYGIRHANIGLENFDLLEGTQEEKNLIKGQLLYFRAFFHLEIMQFFGGIPYVDEVLSASEPFALPRLSYKETALRAAEDFKAAAELLPLDWRKTNTLAASTDFCRITKTHALGYMARNLLYAASPMMNESSTGVNAYDTELCKQVADICAEVIRMCEQPDSRFTLEPWENWPGIFNKISSGHRERPGEREVIQNQPHYEDYYVRWTTTRSYSPGQWGAGNNSTEVPAHNFVQLYHMANGLPITDPASGYDPDDPWTGREPRFYHDIAHHGTRLVVNATSQAAQENEFAQLDNQGRHRHGSVASGGVNGSVSGYFNMKFLPLRCNPWDNQWDNHQGFHPRLRVSDIYLMYAEAVYYGYGSASSSHAGCPYSVQSAIEKIRDRAQLPPLPDHYYANENFFETLMRERAIELAFECLRWHDLRRWNVSDQLKYRQKTAINFDLDDTGKPINFQEVIRTTVVFEKKHNWFPFQTEFTTIHEGFPQNPGW